MPLSVTALDGDRTVSTAVVDAVAEAKDVSPTDVRPPLYQVVDADALNQLFESERDASGGAASGGGPSGGEASGGAASAGEPRVSFDYAGYEITVHGRGEVVVQPETDAERENVE